jgi:hypothetical protein
MKKLTMLFVLVGMMVSTSAFAETWIGQCTDGQRLQFNQTVGGQGSIILKTEAQPRGGIRVAKLNQTFRNNVAICGTVIGNGYGNAATGKNPITQVCMNKSRRIIYLKYKHPYENRPFKSFVFCDASVVVR